MAKTVIVRAPMRISFVGGGSDLPEFYSKFGGLAIGAAIKRYNFVHLIPRPTRPPDVCWRITTTRRGAVPSTHSGGPTIIDAALGRQGLASTYSAIVSSDLVELGSGLGSSSALAAASVHAAALCGGIEDPTPSSTAEAAFRLERDVVGARVGKQDHYMSAFGWLRLYAFEKDGAVSVLPVTASAATIEELEAWMLVTPLPRRISANTILGEHGSAVAQSGDAQQRQHRIKALVDVFAAALENGSLERAAGTLDRVWREKRGIVRSISNEEHNSLYRRSRDAGALGGKMLGAGGGGHMLFLAPPERHPELRRALPDVDLQQVSIDRDGVVVLHCA